MIFFEVDKTSKSFEKSLKKLLTKRNTCDKITELLLRTTAKNKIWTLKNEQQCNPEKFQKRVEQKQLIWRFQRNKLRTGFESENLKIHPNKNSKNQTKFG